MAVLVLISLLSLICLGLEADRPLVDLAAVESLDEGQEVVVKGLLVNLHRYDSGSETLVIAAPDGQATLRVHVSQGLRPQPSIYAKTGDSLRVVGSVSRSGSEQVLYSNADAISLEARSEEVLTVGTLCRCWYLFLGDEVSLRGFMLRPLSSEGYRLYDGGFDCSLALAGTWDVPDVAITSEVIVVGTLAFDETKAALVLEVADVRLS